MKSLLYCLCLVSLLFANVSLPSVFNSHMVLQRDQSVSIWGSANEGETVYVQFNGQTKKTTASGGNWSVTLNAMSAGGPFDMVITGNNRITLTDVMVGEVWHCAGQSNMDTRMNYTEYPNLADSITTANYPSIRYITMRQPGQTIQWQNVTPRTVGSMSATAYFFSRKLSAELNGIAVGVVITAVGGTTIDQWIDPSEVSKDADLSSMSTAGTMYTAWVAPVIGYGIKGTVWLQGENDAARSALAPHYGKRLEILVRSWRQVWNMPKMPFIVAGLCHKGAMQTSTGEKSNQAMVRAAQSEVSDTTDQVWHSVLVDLGEENTWHYSQKPEAGRRLGVLALGSTYGQAGFAYLNPQIKQVLAQDDQVKVVVETHGQTLKTSNAQAPAGFELSLDGNTWQWASAASIHNDTILLTSPIINPGYIRYAWANSPPVNTYGENHLPLTPYADTISAPKTDCNGQENGSAFLDLCDQCVSGNTGLNPCQLITQGEDYCQADGVFEETNKGFDGNGYVNLNNAEDASILFHLSSTKAGETTLSIRFANGSANARPMKLYLNNELHSTIEFASTGSWTHWQSTSVSLVLQAGINALKLASTTSEGGPNIDAIATADSGLSVGSCQEDPTILGLPARSNLLQPAAWSRAYDLMGRTQCMEKIHD